LQQTGEETALEQADPPLRQVAATTVAVCERLLLYRQLSKRNMLQAQQEKMKEWT
tara:strand:- start:2258 stop:2422 length:165 start_codon:yes stop_codon:yes gene_type:complete